MNQERWDQVARIHEATIARPPQDRASFLTEMCGADRALRSEVESLLAQENTTSILDRTLEITAADLLGVPDRLTPSSRLGPYRVERRLGAGGMGEVYLARDETLGRWIALKVLPSDFAGDPERVARLQREAIVLASLNHPNIAAIYGLEEGEGVRALVLEYIDGPTLADRLVSGPLPIDEALPIARQIAEALEAAHDRGIIHRDLKPANIKVTPAGVVKVLDFGLARMIAPDAAAADPSTREAPTITSPAMITSAGIILGTAAYMSPEQAKGRSADRRSDIWAFGAVLYEMLTGHRAFGGDDVADTLANILKAEPDWTALPSDTPAAIRRLLRRCLAKDRKKRLGDASSLQIEVDDAQTDEETAVKAATKKTASRQRWWTGAVMLLTAVIVAVSMRVFTPRSDIQETRLEITTPPTTDPTSIAISSDGRSIVFVANAGDRPRLWVRPFDSAVARPLQGTDGASSPFWGPDSGTVAYFANDTLKTVDIAGHSVRTVLEHIQSHAGGTWNKDAVILVGSGVGPIVRTTASGGSGTGFTRLLAGQRNHVDPFFLPDDRHFLYYAEGMPDVRGVWLADLDGDAPRRLLDADAAAVYARGQLLFVRQGILLAQPFDLARLQFGGAPIAVAEQIASDNRWTAALAASEAGPIAYRTNPQSVQQQFAWFDRTGRQIAAIGDPDPTYGAPSLSRDARRAAFSRRIEGNTDIWVLDLERGGMARITTDALLDSHPLWSPDGSRIVFQRFSFEHNAGDLHLISLANPSNDVTLLSDGNGNIPTDWSADGRFILYKRSQLRSARGWDLYALPLEGERKPFPVVETQFNEQDAQFSPDGRWIAYESDESGRFEVYVRPFQGPGPNQQVSTTGGAQARWRPDGSELFYVALDGRLMVVPIARKPDGRDLVPRAPLPLFKPMIGDVVQTVSRQEYTVSTDGQRFFVNTALGRDVASPIVVVQNFHLPNLKP